MKRIILIALIYVLPLFMIYDGTVYAAQPTKNHNRLVEAQRFFEANLQPGDIVYHVSEGSWIGLATTLADTVRQVVMPDCGKSVGSLTLQTQQALGIEFMDTDQLVHYDGRVWIIYSESALSAPCDKILMAPFVDAVTPSVVLEDINLSWIAIYLYDTRQP